MKPTISSKPSHQQNFPLTHYHYQSTLETSSATTDKTRGTHDLRGFWKLSTDFVGGEAKFVYAGEFLFFSIITALSAWPVISMLVAVGRFLRGY